MKFALVDDTGLIVNVIEWSNENYSPPNGLTAVVADDTTQPGGTWDGTTFTPPAAS